MSRVTVTTVVFVFNVKFNTLPKIDLRCFMEHVGVEPKTLVGIRTLVARRVDEVRVVGRKRIQGRTLEEVRVLEAGVVVRVALARREETISA